MESDCMQVTFCVGNVAAVVVYLRLIFSVFVVFCAFILHLPQQY